MSVERILEALAGRDPAALARAITLVENQGDGFERVLSHAHGLLGRGGTRRIGITGPPGAGKSTLTEALIQRFRAQRFSVGVVAVDPTSPFTGGALLGDRIRMESVSLDPGVFIRSMATRGAQGGLATTTEEIADLLEAFGFERVLVETAGVGVDELVAALDHHYAYLQTSGLLAERRRHRLAARTRAVLERKLRRWLLEATHVEELLALRLDELADGRLSPYDVAAEILAQVKAGGNATR